MADGLGAIGEAYLILFLIVGGLILLLGGIAVFLAWRFSSVDRTIREMKERGDLTTGCN